MSTRVALKLSKFIQLITVSSRENYVPALTGVFYQWSTINTVGSGKNNNAKGKKMKKNIR